MSSKAQDSWTTDSFEDMVTRAFIAVYERKINPHFSSKGNIYGFFPEDVASIRKIGLTVPAPDRVFWRPGDASDIDFVGCPSACALVLGATDGKSWGVEDGDELKSYCRINAFSRLDRLPPFMKRKASGEPYRFSMMHPQESEDMIAYKQYVTVDKSKGRSFICSPSWWDKDPRPVSKGELINNVKTEFETLMMLQFATDMKYQWTIQAVDSETSVTVGCTTENVKSVLYARSLPVAPSGRKRPILHLVHAHKRRVALGTEISIADFLRGTKEIQMNGMKYVVRAPKVLVDRIASCKPASKVAS